MKLLLALVLAAAGFVGFGIYSAQQSPVIVRYAMPVPGLTRPLKVVQLSDSHASRFNMPPSRLQQIVATVNALQPDLVVLTGDYVNGDPEGWSPAETTAALAPFKSLRAPLGVFAVLGNHDDRYKTAAALLDGPVRLLISEWADTGPLLVVGADDLLRGSPAVEAMRRAIRRAPPNRPMLVLAHEPTFFAFLQQRPAVMVAGHTHGGQIKLPILGAWIPDSYAARHPRGLYRENGHLLLVSSGLGTSIVPLRIGVPPEIVEISLVPAPYQVGKNSGTDK